jgi:tetratricopeptide (TPR) repeat protein
MSKPPARKDFFISYHKADKAWAEWIAWQLEEEGKYQVILQAWNFRAGDDLVVGMLNAAEQARCTIAVLSPDYLMALLTKPEWTAAFAQDSTGEKGTLMPVRVRECELPNLLKPITYIDLVGLEVDQAKKRLLGEVKRRSRQPATEPQYPGQGVPPEERAVTREVRFPGSLPPVWNLLQRRNANFTGREELLEKLREVMTSGEPVVLFGLGGKGKTALAVEYVYRNHPYYDRIWWLRSEEAAVLSDDYAALAGPLGLPEKDAPDLEAQVIAVRQCLGRLDKWLLIFDNATGPEAVKGYLPQGEGGQVLITSRNPAWQGLGRPLEVEVLSPPEAVAFLLQRTGQGDEAAAAALAEDLGYLPLALDQAGAYLEVTGRTLNEYLEFFRSSRLDLWAQEAAPRHYEKTVATTWELAMQQVRQDSEAAADLLSLSAFLAPDDIPLELLRQGMDLLTETLAKAIADDITWDEALGALQRYSLVDVSIEADSFSVHRLVQAVVRDRLDQDSRRKWAKIAIDLLNAGFPEGMQVNVKAWPLYARLLPHAMSALARAGELNLEMEEVARLWNQTGLYLGTRAEFLQALDCYRRSLQIYEATFGPNHPYVAIAVNNLGSVLHDLGDLSGAQDCFELALRIDEAAYGPDHPDVANRVNNLGSVLRAMGDLAGAQECYERALRIDEAAYGLTHPNVAIDVNNLGSVLKAQGDLVGAKECYERALVILEALGPELPQVATSVNNLGSVLRAMGDLAGAQECYKRALRIDEAAYGLSHPNVAIDVNNLGLVLQALDDLAEAKKCFERALDIFTKFLGPDHPNTQLVRENLESLREVP